MFESGPQFSSLPRNDPKDDRYKQAIAQSFGQASTTYANQATAQRACAHILLDLLSRVSRADDCPEDEGSGDRSNLHFQSLPAGPILEFGCGTGFLTQGLIARFAKDHALEITDLSPAMVAECQRQMATAFARPDVAASENSATIRFSALDAEAIPSPAGPYALIASNFALQWFQTPQRSLEQLRRLLMPGGWLLVSFPSRRSFPQWRSHCEALDLPFPARDLPDAEVLLAGLRSRDSHSISEAHWLPLQFDNALAFLRHFKAIGAQNQISREKRSDLPRPTPAQFRHLITRWNQHSSHGITDQYHAVCLAIQNRNFE